MNLQNRRMIKMRQSLRVRFYHLKARKDENIKFTNVIIAKLEKVSNKKVIFKFCFVAYRYFL